MDTCAPLSTDKNRRSKRLLRKLMTSSAWIYLSRTFSSFYYPDVYRISRGSIMKTGPYVRYGEVAALQFLAANTTIPVPRVYDFFQHPRHPKHACIIMEYIDAPCLQDVWSSTSDEDKQNIVLQLLGYIKQLRQLIPPRPGYVESADGSACLDFREPHGHIFGPFTVEAYHTFLGRDWVQKSEEHQQHHDLFKKCGQHSYKSIFTHGDLAPRNILVKDGKIMGIVDWELAGWFPEYMEYARLQRSNYGCQIWVDMLRKGMEPYDEEAKVEDILSSIFFRH